MPTVKRSPTLRSQRPRLHQADDDVQLPTSANKPPENFADYVSLFFGEKGVGKTSLVAQFNKALVAQWEPGRRHLEIMQVAPKNWKQYKEYQRLAIEDNRFQTIANDTIDRAYRACLEHVCRERGYTHPNEAKDFGQTWSAVFSEFEDTMNQIHNSGKTPLFVSHAKYKEIEDALTRTTTEMYVPTCTDKALEYMRAVCDFAFCLTKRETERVIVVRGTSTIWASCGVPNTFLCPDTGKELAEIPMGNSPEEAYKNLCLGFENKLRGRILEAPEEPEEEDEVEEKPKKKKLVIKKRK